MKQKFTAEQLEAFWQDSANWKWGIYRCPADPRVIVSKRAKLMGWTINFSHRYAWPVLALMVALMSAPLMILASAGEVNTLIWFVALIVEVILLCFGCWYYASPKRYG